MPRSWEPEGRTAVVTGAARGPGAGLARLLSRRELPRLMRAHAFEQTGLLGAGGDIEERLIDRRPTGPPADGWGK
ncbi:hypothetical protein [Streptomyces sp. NPDC093089]|uniref:hypothetical protein n=1 Tax=Streptomyces sp. NPDC093089 TaxID=3366024 RepID=UPI00380FF63E